jgi:hypothetical protein
MRYLWIFALMTSVCGVATAQDIHVRALDGKSGKPLVNRRLLVFMFDHMSATRTSIDLHTDSHGEAVLSGARMKGKFIQVFTDFMTDCVLDPNREQMEVAMIHSNGITRKNTCSANVNLTANPHELVVFARKPTLREEMAW